MTFLEERDLTVLPADKEVGFAILSSKLYKCKSDHAVSSVFACHEDVDVAKVKRHAFKLCKPNNLSNLSKYISDAKKDFLQVFFSAKTHIPDKPFIPIVSECGTWQRQLSKFLQSKLSLLNFEDPYLVETLTRCSSLYNLATVITFWLFQ